MSWQLNIAPAMSNPEVADWTIPENATPEQVDAVADECLPHGLRAFTQTADDWRLRRPMARLEAERGIPPTKYDVFVWEGGMADRNRWDRWVGLRASPGIPNPYPVLEKHPDSTYG